MTSSRRPGVLPLEDLIRLADKTVEDGMSRGLGLEALLARFLPVTCRALGATGAFVTTRDESRETRTFRHGRASGGVWLTQPLDVAGRKIGRAGFLFPKAPADRRATAERIDFVCEQLDLALWVIQASARKQDLVERITRALTRQVFDQALHDAVVAFREAAGFERLAVVYRDDDDSPASRLLYRVYKGSRCVAKRGKTPHRGLEAGLRRWGAGVIEAGSGRAAKSLGFGPSVSWPLRAGVKPEVRLGEIVVEAPHGLDSFSRDLLHVFANAVSQRLVDYNRERRHLSQFFSPEIIDELVEDADYQNRRLTPRVPRAGILYADINSFTKLCEKALIAPERIGSFVDRWSTGAVKIVWKHGGVFDKMVGDCVIAHFGPPFYRIPARERALRALRASLEIQAFTKGLERDPEFRRLARKAGLPGLGVAVGVNLCPAAIGLFGPNRDLTAFSRGMNETARLQSHAGFREIVAMDSVARVLAGSARREKVRFEGPLHAAVKNVKKPLRYYRVVKAGH